TRKPPRAATTGRADHYRGGGRGDRSGGEPVAYPEKDCRRAGRRLRRLEVHQAKIPGHDENDVRLAQQSAQGWVDGAGGRRGGTGEESDHFETPGVCEGSSHAGVRLRLAAHGNYRGGRLRSG